MKTEKQRTGKLGEDLACAYLRKNGYRVTERNYSFKTGELDIVAIRGNIICFVEVKTRSGTEYGLPCQAVDLKKQRKIRRTAEHYMLTHPVYRYLQMRMDIVEILLKEEKHYIRYLKNAF